jgi:uncharacterized oxidoreductase
VKTGQFRFGVELDIVRETPATALIDGKWGFGQVVASKAMDIAIEKALHHSISMVAVFKCNHIGLVATYPMKALNHQMIGIVLCNSEPQVAPYGGKARKMGTNPIAIVIPTKEAQPIILDMATSIVAAGKVRAKYATGERTPEGWIIDGDGNPTVDPAIFIKGDRKEPGGGMLLPLGGYKGFCLSVIIDLLGGALTGAGCSSTEFQRGNGVILSAIKLTSFTPLEDFLERVETMIQSLKQTPTAPGFAEILMPGEVEFRAYEQRMREGIDIDEFTIRNLAAVAKDLNVSLF